ncbi:SusC/RagA family TonB-linked outer membrane protein [Parapedobacter koreensis]|uniref:TonB-linked outer membrane protein, SusC/RagA family n=1 Tax=Parapedobacter koreensis TaxID=332977 RepID=A0A1H7FDL0_9SPHI|nr:SusC/RagA family TonB-linked outer membrane protein [Parapedobacter koreensis]SEK24181.1 TonB-linked outer membrane protein, SusC/RagA family [Parapedobacter koreensis]
MKYLSFLFLVIIASNKVYGQQTITLRGVVKSATDGSPLIGATIQIVDSPTSTKTDDDGNFTITTNQQKGQLRIQYLGFKVTDVNFTSFQTAPFQIDLEPEERMIEEVEISTGYQRLSSERTTGSFVQIDNELLNRSLSTDILSRLDGVTNGLLFDKTASYAEPQLSIRGPSTIHADASPLIILDNFEYNGDIRNINPNDIANVTVLKDAVATSIWGARAGNGVIVITSKSGQFNQRPNISLTTNISVTQKPNQFTRQQLSSSDFIDLETFLFSRGHYSYALTGPEMPSVTPVVWMLEQRRLGNISSGDSSAAVDAFRQLDVRNDISKYFDRNSVAQQHALSVNGGGQYNRYYASVGWDKNLNNKVGSGFDRLTMNFNNTFSFINNKLEVSTGLIYTQSQDDDNTHGLLVNYPYAQLADADGNSLPIARYRPSFIDTVGQGRLLDWNYRPLDELGFADQTVKATDLKFNAIAQYALFPFLKANVRYQYGRGNSNRRNHRSQETFFTRDLINQFSSIAPNGQVSRPVPLGGILDLSAGNYEAHHLRGQLDWDKDLGLHSINGIVGAELSNMVTQSNSNRFYGYNAERETVGNIDPINFYPSIITGWNTQIPTSQNLQYLTDRFVSFYANANYTFNNKYNLYGSFRRDASNLFGVATNQKWTPLWSAGFSWKVSDEGFYNLNWLPSLKLRSTYGKSGNVDRSVSAYLIASAIPIFNDYNQPNLRIGSPANPNLKWETIETVNAALDFSILRSGRITGSIEQYWKLGSDLMGDAEMAPSSGRVTFRGNTASMAGHGTDVTINSQNLLTKLKWTTTALYSYTWNKVTQYLLTPANVNSYMLGAYAEGRPINAIFGYKWGGLDGTNGNPNGYLDGEISSDYTAITSSTDINDLVFFGSTSPTHFGSIRNTFDWKGVSFSFNVLFKLGYYFRRNGLDYSQLFTGNYAYGDFEMRWRQPGDELHTTVPAMVYPAISQRETFYRYNEIQILNGSHIRLQDVRLAYIINRNNFQSIRFKSLQLFAIASNLGLLWNSNNKGIDPESRDIAAQYTVSGGLRLEF